MAWDGSSETGTGTAADPYIFALSWLDLDSYVTGTAGVAAGNILTLPTDPAAHTLFGFDNTTNTYKTILIGSNLSYDQPTNTLSASGVGGLASTDIDTSSELRTIVTDESGTGALIFAGGDIGAGTATTPSANDNDTSIATTAFVTGEVKKKYVSGTEADFYGTLLDPQAIYAVDGTNHAVTLITNTPAAFTIAAIRVTCDADPTTEITLTFQHKAAGVGYGSPTTIEAVATTAGVANITTGIDDTTIPANTKVFATLSDPDDALNECAWQIEGDWD